MHVSEALYNQITLIHFSCFFHHTPYCDLHEHYFADGRKVRASKPLDIRLLWLFLLGRFHPFSRPRRPLGWVEVSSTLSRTSALDGGGGQPHAPASSTPRERPGTHFTGGCVGPRAEKFVATGIRSRTVRPLAQSVQRLSYGLSARPFLLFLLNQKNG